MDKIRLRDLLLYEFRKNSTPTQALRNICESEGEDALFLSTVKPWFSKFAEVNEQLEDAPRSGRPPVLNSNDFEQHIQQHPSSSSHQLAKDFGVHHTTVLNYLHQLGFVNKKGAEVPHALTQQQKHQRVAACTELLARLSAGMQLSQLITCYEKWVYLNNKTAQKQWLKPNELGEPTPRRLQHAPKVLLCVWWCSSGLVRYELVPAGQTINADIYQQQLQRVQDQIRRPPFSAKFRGGVLLLHDNAQPHVAFATQQKIEQLRWAVLPHPPYSPDISPCDYYLFRSMEHFLRGKEFADQEQVENALDDFFGSKNDQFYKKGIESLPERWGRIIDQNGDYIID